MYVFKSTPDFSRPSTSRMYLSAPQTVTNEVFHYDVVTNVVEHYTTVTNVVKYVPEPGTSPAAAYSVGAGAVGDVRIAGAAGWDAYGVPDGMNWNRETGALEGAAVKSGLYDLILVSGSGTETKIMRTTIEVKGFTKIIGHVGVQFDGKGAPYNCLTSYAKLPAGVKWDKKTEVMSGIPTKAQTIELETVYGDPVTIEILPAATTMAGTYNGLVGYREDGVEGDPWRAVGNLSLSVSAAGKLTAKVLMLKTTYSFTANAWDSVTDGVYRSTMRTKAGDELTLVLDTNGDWRRARITASTFKRAGDASAYSVSAWRNEHGKTDAIASDPIASEFIARIKAQKKVYLKATPDGDGRYTLEVQAASKGADVTLTFNANGTVSYSGKVNGASVSGSSTLSVDGESYFTIFDLVVPISTTQAMYFAMGYDLGPSSTPLPDFQLRICTGR